MDSTSGDQEKNWILGPVLDSRKIYQWIRWRPRRNKGDFEASNSSIQMYDDTNFWNGKTKKVRNEDQELI